MLSSQSYNQHCEDFAGKCLIVLSTNSVDGCEGRGAPGEMHMHYLLGPYPGGMANLPDTKFAGVLKKGWMMSSCFLLFLVIVTMSVNKLPVLNLFFSWHPHLMTNMPTPKNS